MDVYVVTGSSRGLGAGIVQELQARGGAEVVTIGRHGATIVADLGEGEGIAAACAAVQERLAGSAWTKAVLINNAGVVEPVGPWGSFDAATLVRHSNVNLAAPMALTDAFLRATGATPLKRLIHISSGAGRRAIAGWGAYCATKAGLDIAARTLAAESRPGVEVVSLAPGVIDTDMQATVRSKPAEVFADVERFRTMKADGTLRAARDVARDILAAEASGALFAEPVADLRTLCAGLR